MVGWLVSSGGLKAIYSRFLLTQGGVFTCECVSVKISWCFDN